MVCRRWQKGKLLRERLPLQRLTENRLHRDRSEGGAPRRANSPSSRAARRTDARSGKTRKRGIASASSSRRLHRGLHTYGRRNPASSLEKKSWLCRTFAEPSDGLEPSTPSLPWDSRGSRSQPTATVFAYLSRFRVSAICHRLPPVAPARLHKGSIRRCLLWLRQLAASPVRGLPRGECGQVRTGRYPRVVTLSASRKRSPSPSP
jgi:hypothetical protein